MSKKFFYLELINWNFKMSDDIIKSEVKEVYGNIAKSGCSGIIPALSKK